jgi:hypothetical protein
MKLHACEETFVYLNIFSAWLPTPCQLSQPTPTIQRTAPLWSRPANMPKYLAQNLPES